MLTLFPTNLTEPDFKTAEVNVCFLPDQISIYVFYGVLFVATLAVLAVVVFLGLDSREEIKQPRSPTIGPISVEEGMRGSGSIASRGQGTGSLLSLRMRIHHLYPVYFRALGYVVLHSVAAFVIFVLWEHLY